MKIPCQLKLIIDSNRTVSEKTSQIEKTIVHSVNPPATNTFPEQTQNLQLEYQPVQMSSTKTNNILISKTPIHHKNDFSNPNYVSPSDILPVRKSLSQKPFVQQKTKKISCYYFDTRKKCLAVNLVCLGKKPLRRHRQVENKDKIPKDQTRPKKSKKLKHVEKRQKNQLFSRVRRKNLLLCT